MRLKSRFQSIMQEKTNSYHNFLLNHSKTIWNYKMNIRNTSYIRIYIQRALICDQAQLSSSIRLEMTAWWRWRGQRWHFVVFHLFFDICFDLTISTDKKHIGHLKGCFCYINRNKKNIFLQKETPWCCFICLKFLALCKVIFIFF